MDSNNQSNGERKSEFSTIRDFTKRDAEASAAIRPSRKRWDESPEDRERFQRFACSCYEGNKTGARHVLNYADKPRVFERPRPPSPEYLEFKGELAAARALRALFDL